MEAERKKPAALVASGDQAACQVVGGVLQRNGFLVTALADGRQVIPAVANTHFHLVFLDLLLPNVSGMQVFQVIKGIPEMKIVLLVRNEQSFAAMIKVAREGGALGPLVYPLIPDKVEHLLREIKAA